MGIRKGDGPIQRLRSSFSLKLVVLFFSVVLVIGGIGGIIYVQTGDALQKSTEESMEHSTVLQANTVGEWIERTSDKTAHISSSTVVESGDEGEIGAFLQTEREGAPESVVAIHYYDTTTHDVLASSDVDAIGTSYEEVATANYGFEFEDATDASTITTHPYDDPVTGEAAIAFVSGVPDDPDRAIVTVVDLASQTDYLEKPSATDGAFTHIVNSRGTVIMSHHITQINTQNMGPENEYKANSKAVMRGLDGETDYVEMDMHGGEMAMGFAPVPGTDWVIMTHIPKDAAYALQDDITQSVAALVVLSVLGLGLVGAVVGRNTTRSIGRLADQANELEEGNLEAEIESDRIDEIGQLYDAFDSMRISLRDQIEEVKRARAQTDELNAHLESKADEYRDVMQACADGDFTQRMNADSESEAMENIALEFNQMMSDLEHTTEQLSNFANEVASLSEEVTASSEEVQSASTQVAVSIQEIATGAERQNERLQSMTHEMESLSTTTEEIAASSNEVADLAEATAQTGQDGQDAAQTAVSGLNKVEVESEQAVEAIEALEAEIEQIDDLVEFISNVAKQTNMLALNANIEVARSNTNNDAGFGAVASEVKELANETKEAAETIEDRIESIKAQTERATDEVQTTSEQIVYHRDTLERTVDALEKIAAYAERTNEGVQEISASTQQQAVSTQEVVAMVDEVATISEETTIEAESAAAAGEEQNSALTEVTESIDDLANRAMQLSSQLDQFETDAGLESEPSELFGSTVNDPEDTQSELEDNEAGSEPVEHEFNNRTENAHTDERFSFVEDEQMASPRPDGDAEDRQRSPHSNDE